MSWTPDAELERLITSAMAFRRDAMTRRQRDEKNDLAEKLTERGMVDSSPHIAGQDKIDAAAFDDMAQGIIDDVLDLFRRIYGSVPAEAAPWIRNKLEGWLYASAAGVARAAQQVRQRHHAGGAAEGPIHALRAAKWRLETEFATLELRAKLKELTPPERASERSGPGADCFICHASEDKAAAARPIADALRARGYTVWLDETEMKVGDRLLEKIDEGLVNCRFGLVIVSPSFFGKQWTRRELAGLVAREDAEERTIILPVWLDVDKKVIARHLPSLAGVLAARMADGLPCVIDDIVRAMGPPAAVS